MNQKLFIAKPSNMKFWHIFKEDSRSLCGKVAILFVDKTQCEKVTGTEKYVKGQDCKACFNRLNKLITNKTKIK